MAHRAGSSARAKAHELRWRAFTTCAKAGGGVGLGIGVLTAFTSSSPLLALTTAVVAGGSTSYMVARSTKSGADQWIQGAKGEERTARVMKSLARDGWFVVHDIKIPPRPGKPVRKKGGANGDHFALHPSGEFGIYLDTKAWHVKNAPVYLDSGRLMYGHWDQGEAVSKIRYETERIGWALHIPMLSVLVLDGALIDRNVHPDGVIKVDHAFYVVEQAHVVALLRSIPGAPDRHRFRQVTTIAKSALLPYN